MDLKKFLPRTLISLLSESKDFKLKAAFLKGTTLFADISGFTQMSEELQKMGREGSEILTDILNKYFNSIIKIIYKYNGDIMRFAGDAITSFFEEKEMALSAGVEIISFMRENEICKTPKGDFNIKIKIGIASGIHTLLLVGDEFFDYVFAGNPVDWAAEAEHIAQAGEVIISPMSEEKIESISLLSFKKEKFIENEKIKRFIHPVLYEKISSGFSSILNEHRKTVIIFLSFKGIESYYNLKDLKVLQNFYIQTRKKVDEYEGFLNKVDFGDKGSKFLITFGAPVSHEDDIDRAIHFSKEIQKIAKENNLKVSIGINYGTIFSGIVGNEERCEYTVMGDAVNLSARLMQYSSEGEIIVSSFLKDQADSFSFKYLDSVKLKGKSEPVEIFSPEEKKDEAEEEFYVQKKELVEEAEKFIKEKELEPKVLEIAGEGGIGKSAFLKYLIKEKLKGYDLIFGRCQEFSKNFPYYPWEKILKDLFDLLFFEDKTDKWQKLLKEKYPHFYKFSFVLLDFLKIENKAEKIQIDEKTKQSILIKEISILLNEICSLKKIAIVLNNFQWADPSSVELFYNLCLVISKPSPLFIVIGREKIKDLSNVLNFLSLKIENFNFFETKEFVFKFLNCKNLQEKILKEIFEASKGNPHLLKETLKNYQDSGYLSKDKEHPDFILIDETKKPKIPTTLEEVVLSKFDKISPEEQFLLKILSVFGENIKFDLLEKIFSIYNIQKETILKIIERKEFLGFNEKENYYYFLKNYLRSSIYNSIDFSSRRKFHKIAAEIYKEFYKEYKTDIGQIISFHYIESGDLKEGVDFILKTGENAYKNYAFPSAIYYFNSLYNKKEILDKEKTGYVLYYLSDSMIKIGKFKEAVDVLKEDLIENVPEEDLKSSLYLNLSDAYRFTGNFQISSKYIEKAEMCAKSDIQKFNVENKKGTILAQMSKYIDSLKIFEEIEKKYKGKILEEELKKISIIKGTLLFTTGKQKEAFEILEEAKKYFEKKFDIFSLIKIIHNLASFSGISGEHNKALKYFIFSKNYQEKYGIYQNLIISLNEIGYEYMLLSKWKEAEYYFNYALSLSKKFEDPMQIIILCNLSELHQYYGELEKARNLLKNASQYSYKYNFKKIDVLFYWIEFLSNIPYPKAVLRFIEKIKIEIEKQKVGFILLLVDAYLSYYYYLTKNFSKAKEIAFDVYNKAKEKNLKKELFLSLRTIILCSKKEERKKYLMEILDVSEETGMSQYKIEAIILNLQESYDKNLVKKCDFLLKKAPFANLLWRYNTILSEYFFKNNKIKSGRKRIEKAYNTYKFIFQNLPSDEIKKYFENQKISKKLISLYYGTQTPPTGPSPQT